MIAVLILNEPEIRELVDADAARTRWPTLSARFIWERRRIANVISLPFGDPDGVAHIKAGHVHSDAVWTAKVSADFYPETRRDGP